VSCPKERPQLKRLTAICLALPEGGREVSGQHARFHVRKRTFAYFLDDHHGDGIVAVVCKVPRHEMTTLLEHDPTRFYVPDYLGPKGWIAMCLDVKPVDWAQARRLVSESYGLVAPKRLADSCR
jgi:predicted DNA-binding protein (MmcQ/YjbR family)